MSQAKPRDPKRHPMQPIEFAEDDHVRFRKNAIVRTLLDFGQERGFGLNALSIHKPPFSREDWNQFAQLIGYSVVGFGELSYAFKDDVREADKIAEKLVEES